MKIEGDYGLSDTEFEQMQLHSVMNLLTIINGDLQVYQATIEDDPGLDAVVVATFALAADLRAGRTDGFSPEALAVLGDSILSNLHRIRDQHPNLFQTEEDQLVFENFDSIFSIFRERVEEIRMRLLFPDRWETFSVVDFEADFRRFFMAVEKNSKGRYRIVYNIADQNESDYYIKMTVESTANGTIRIPILLKDTIRDLLANARKYTPPGGSIQAGLIQDENRLRFVVHDTGVGIPADELALVPKFGYRATNVRHMKTMGGGYGLTKAWWVTRHFGGEMTIESEMGRGTRVSIDVPLPEVRR